MASHATESFLRPLLPATASCSADVPEVSQPKRKRQTVACTSCQIKRVKCSGSFPCDGCAGTDFICCYDPRKDKRRKEALKDAQQTKEALRTIINIIYQGTDSDLDNLKAKLKTFASPEAVMEELLNNVHI
ncbi:hypothetical protein ASPVEDRAFT_38981 [Aspergillus versicolor CBS 583.65]|uniref:Zn(2)-C6 fungal-type domain-containing protein n=1 Tax=Aspergillus versicolor CBS 583.65 TaxID=1036611 RepID=A0A1L9PDK5_ASPVE|nr:uncharacterized protein ASPVEDRAFT_38981 [Aspergillus versicolor CBS 583.65]OJI99571.1 hypothetical protein ASPVEDRAFT_38981 [Aspergillus versicolor CBS 583.65]